MCNTAQCQKPSSTSYDLVVYDRRLENVKFPRYRLFTTSPDAIPQGIRVSRLVDGDLMWCRSDVLLTGKQGYHGEDDDAEKRNTEYQPEERMRPMFLWGRRGSWDRQASQDDAALRTLSMAPDDESAAPGTNRRRQNISLG